MKVRFARRQKRSRNGRVSRSQGPLRGIPGMCFKESCYSVCSQAAWSWRSLSRATDREHREQHSQGRLLRHRHFRHPSQQRWQSRGSRNRRYAPLARAPAAVRPQPLPASPSEAALERHIFALIIRAPRAKLPADLIDSTTGLPKNNLQVVCHAARTPHLFLCVVRLAGNATGKLLVRYRAARGGGGVLTWVGRT